jgi:hypothetical protein
MGKCTAGFFNVVIDRYRIRNNEIKVYSRSMTLVTHYLQKRSTLLQAYSQRLSKNNDNSRLYMDDICKIQRNTCETILRTISPISFV